MKAEVTSFVASVKLYVQRKGIVSGVLFLISALSDVSGRPQAALV